MVTTRVDVPHTKGLRWHEWRFLGAQRVYRDSIGRKGSTTTAWMVVGCNNTGCDGVLLVRARDIEDMLNGTEREEKRSWKTSSR